MNKLIGKNIREMRTKANISQKEFAQFCRISQPYLSRIEHGHEIPSIEILENIADKLGKPLAVILFLSIEESDIRKDKLEIWNKVLPTLKNIIEIIWE